MDTSRVCRCCMKEVAPWELPNFDQRVVKMFTHCTNIEIPEIDILPKQFCYDCTLKIESSYTFVKEAQHANETLTNLLTQRTVIIEPVKRTEIIETPPSDNEDDIVHSEVIVIDDQPAETTEKSTTTAEKETVANKKYVCPECKKLFQSKVWFEKHVRNQHNIYCCPECPKKFFLPSQLSAHAITHSTERQYACSCGKRYKRRKELSLHMRTHAAARPYQCDHCKKSFKFKSVLKSHMVVHKPDKPHLCYICGWGFKQAGNLAVHLRSHSGVKSYACECGFRTSCATSLRRHEARHRARPLRCRTCDKRFHDTTALTRHARSHTGARPYQCPACPRAFADSWKRKLHLMRAHRVPLARIPRMRADPAVLVPQ